MFWRKTEKETWVDLRKNRLRNRRKKREKKRRVVQPSRTCLVLFHQPSPWKLASFSSSLFPSILSSLSFAWNEVIRESERGRDRERESEGERKRHSHPH